jgi:alkylhydroperoxidase family enzyme
MTTYHFADIEVRPDLAAAHDHFFERLRRPGSWWTGAERVAIAAEARQAKSCALCRQRKAALSPFSIDGAHDAAVSFAEPVVEAVHRLVTDPGRLTQRWFADVTRTAMTPEAYVELVSIVAALMSIDSFCIALGIPLRELPAPEPGSPTGYRPASARMEDAWVPMIPADANHGAEADLWISGKTGNVVRALSVVPDEVRTLLELSSAHYLPMAAVPDPRARTAHLDRQQIELVAGRISALNQCYY